MIFSFSSKHRLLQSGDCVVVAVSGGVDSMFLLWLASLWKKKGFLSEVRAVHFNHGTRLENHAEEQMVSTFCGQLSVPLQVVPLEMTFQSNFEFKAREKRLMIGLDLLRPGELLLTAHHIDDSFEWSLMQKLKSGNLRSSLGIPAINGLIRRPLMCLTKKQIRHFAQRFSIPFSDDPSNKDTRYERNYMRHHVIPTMAKRFPSYLHHYVEQSNQLARKLGLHLISTDNHSLLSFRDSLGGVWLYHRDFKLGFHGQEEAISQVIESISSAERGVLRQQIGRAIVAAEKNNNGPLLFSGGVVGFLYPGALYFIHQNQRPLLEERDHSLLKQLQNVDFVEGSEIPRVDISEFTIMLNERLSQRHSAFPHLLIANGQRLNKFWPGLKRVDPLFPKTTAFCIEKGFYYRNALHFLHYWRKHDRRFSFAICII